MCCYLRLKNNAPYICRVVFRSQKECGGDAVVFYSYFPIFDVYITMEEVLRVYKRPYLEKEQDFPPKGAKIGSRLIP